MGIFDTIFSFIYIPFGLLFKGLYYLIGNYGVAIIVFALIAKLAMIPFAVKQEKNRLLMLSVQPKMQQLQAKYKGNTRDPKYAEEMQNLYQNEGYSPMKGCLPSLLQLPIIWAIWTAIRNPFSYIFNFSNELINKIAETLYNANINGFASVIGDQSKLASWVATNQIPLYGYAKDPAGLEAIRSLIPADSNFFQLDLDFNFLFFNFNLSKSFIPLFFYNILN